MSPLYPINDWSDINLYFNIGKSVFEGKVLYSDIFDHKGPLIFLIYGIGAAISYPSFFGMYILEVLAWFVMTYFVYKLAILFLDKGYALLVALAYPVLFVSHLQEGGSAEEFITVCYVVSLFYFVRYFKEGDTVHSTKHMFIHGLMSAIVFFIKLNLVVFWIFPLLAIGLSLIKNKEYNNLLHNLFAYTGGLLAIGIPICLYFIVNSSLNEAYQVYIDLNRRYAKLGGLGEIINLLVTRFYIRLRFDTVEFIIILLGAAYFPFRFLKKNLIGATSILLSFASVFSVIFMSDNYVYYYSIPYYAYIALGCIVLGHYLYKYIKIQFAWHICLLFAFIGIGVGVKWVDFFGYSNEVLLGKKEDESLITQFSIIIEKEKDPTLLNLGLNLGNAIFTKCAIPSEFKYFISPNLPYHIYPQMRDEQTEYIKSRRPQFVILNGYSFNFEYFRNLPALNEQYTVVDTYHDTSYGEQTYYLYKRNE